MDENEDYIKVIGGFGRWQKLFLLMCISPTKMVANWMLNMIVFLAPKTTFRCSERSNSSEILNSTCYSDCIEYEYFSEFKSSIISEWDLICSRDWLANLSQTICVFGVFVGCYVFGFLADRYGRRTIFLTSCMQKLIVVFLIPLSPTFWIFMLLRFLDGCATAGNIHINHIILIETVDSRKREIVNSYGTISSPIGQIAMVFFAYFFRSWDQFILSQACINLIFLSYFFIVPESPKWLFSTGKVEEAKAVMTKIAKCNRLPTDQISQVAEAIHKQTELTPTMVKASYMDLLVKPSLRMNNFLSCVIWFVTGLSFYGSNQYIGQTSKNPFISVAMSGAMQIPGGLINGICNKRYGRRRTQIYFLTVSAVCNGLMAAPDDWFYFKLVVGSVGVAACFGTFSAMYMFTPELFPTVARTMATTASSSACRAGSMVAPFVAGLQYSAPLAPPAVFALAPLMGALACYFLPETRGIKLSDHIED